MDDTLYQKLLGFALHYVSIRLRSEKEIREYILKKIRQWGLSQSLGQQILTRLEELGYVDDLKFSQAFISARNQFRPKGKFLLVRELKLKGVEEDIIKKALDYTLTSLEDAPTQMVLARRAAEKKLRGLTGYSRQECRDKLYSFLLRRGFDHDTIRNLIDEISHKGLQ